MLTLTDDNRNFGESLTTTNAAETPINISQHKTFDTISGHDIFNQVDNYTISQNKIIEVKSRQKRFILNFCDTPPGQASTLFQPEAVLFQIHFYASSQLNKCSTLCDSPFLNELESYSYGFTSILNQASIHMTNTYSTTSTDTIHMCYYFYSLGSMIVNKHHSRDVFERGFVVDNRSVRDKVKSELAGSIDMILMVQNLSYSQNYIKYIWFLTFTANQIEHPVLSHLHKWKTSMNWSSNIDNFEK